MDKITIANIKKMIRKIQQNNSAIEFHYYHKKVAQIEQKPPQNGLQSFLVVVIR